jgi:hypothetical protein
MGALSMLGMLIAPGTCSSEEFQPAGLRKPLLPTRTVAEPRPNRGETLCQTRNIIIHS